MIFEDSREIQSLFQIVKMQFWYRGNTFSRSGSWKRRSSDEKWWNQSSQEMENSYQDKRSGKLLGVCKLLLEIYQELQSHNKTSQWTQRKKGMEIGKGVLKSIWRVKREDHKLAYTYSTKKRRKILSRNRCSRICYRRSSILRTRRKMKTYCLFVKNNATYRMKLQDLWQETTCYSGSSYKMETILIEHLRKVWSLDWSKKSQVLQGTTQTQ